MELFDKKFVHFMWDDELEGKGCFIADFIDDLESRVNDNDSMFLCRVQSSGNKAYPFKEDGNDWKFAYYDPNYALKIAHHEGRQIQCRRIGYENWVNTPKPCWDNKHWEYRIKPEQQKFYVGIGTSEVLTYNQDNTYKHVYAETESVDEAHDWIEAHKKFEPVMRAWEEGKKIQHSINDAYEWVNDDKPQWFTSDAYRVKPEKRRMTNREIAKWLAEGKGQMRRGLSIQITYTYSSEDTDIVPEDLKIRAWNETEWREPEVEE